VSEAARMELKKLLTKKRLERKTVAIHQEWEVGSAQLSEKDEQDFENRHGDSIDAASLPGATYEISTEDKEGVPKGSLIVNDPVLQYFNTMLPGEKPKTVIVASESQSLRSVYPLINGVGEVEALLDGGSQIVSMSKAVAEELEIQWNPGITVQMQSANRSLEQTLGLAKNVPFRFGHITVYLQVHVIGKPAYKVLLGRPFDTVTESVVRNDREGGQSITLTDPNTGAKCVVNTHERGKAPTVLKRPKNADFQPSMI
jgi:gag-polyprotein putative aspartyl protease